MYTYELILSYTGCIFGATVLCYLVLAALVRDRCVYAAMLLSWPQLIGILTIYTIIGASTHVHSYPLAIFVGLLESGLFIVSSLFLGWILKYVRDRLAIFAVNEVVVGVSLCSIAIQCYLIFKSGFTFGILSEGSRLEFIKEGGQSLVFTYLLTVLQSSFILLIAARLAYGKFMRLDVMAIVVSFVLSILAASKGSAVMNLIYIYAVARAFGFRVGQRLSARAISWLVLFGVVAFGYVYLLSQLLDIPLGTSVNTAVSRFILAADGRALAIDDSVHSIVSASVHGSLLAELFKGFANRLAVPISVVPLGIAQYVAAFNTELFAGSNAGFGATILTYYNSGSDLVSILIAMCFAACICFISMYWARVTSHPFARLFSVSIAFTLGWNFVQDFQAFFVVSTLMFLWLATVVLSRVILGVLPRHPIRVSERQ